MYLVSGPLGPPPISMHPWTPCTVLPQGLCPAPSPGNALPPLGMLCPGSSFPHVLQCHLLTEAFPDPSTYNSTLSIILYPLTCFIFLHHPICVCLLDVCFSSLEFKLLSTKISVCFIHCGPSSTQKNAWRKTELCKYLFSGWMNDQWISLNFREIKSLSQE